MTSHTYELLTQRLREAEESPALVVMGQLSCSSQQYILIQCLIYSHWRRPLLLCWRWYAHTHGMLSATSLTDHSADVSHQYQPDQADLNSRVSYVKRFASGSLDLVNCLAQYSKPLVAAVNGPAVGFSAGLLGHFDFIYAAEDAYLFTPFTSCVLFLLL